MSFDKGNAFVNGDHNELVSIPDIARMVTTRSHSGSTERSDENPNGSFETTRIRNDWLSAEIASVLERQQSDPNIKFVADALTQGSRPQHSEVIALSPTCRHYWSLWQSLELHDGCLYKRFHKRNGVGSYLQLIVPNGCKETILYQMHNNLLSGHLGEKKTREKIMDRFYWYNLRDDVRQWVKTCLECQANKKPIKLPRAPLGTMSVGTPFDRLSTDYLGPLPITPRGNR